jgi:hypothetical protein
MKIWHEKMMKDLKFYNYFRKNRKNMGLCLKNSSKIAKNEENQKINFTSLCQNLLIVYYLLKLLSNRNW